MPLLLCFHLAHHAEGRLLSLRLMQLSIGKCAAISGAAALILICSCEQHHLGEMPEVQKEHVDPIDGHDEGAEAVSETSTSPASAPAAQPASPIPTPAEFFPAKSR